MSECAPFADLIAELALGTLVGKERATTLAHVDACPHCRALLESLALTADALLQMAPTAEPPVGFESRVVGAVRTERLAPERRSPSRRVVAGIAAALLLTLGVGFAAGLMAADRPAGTRTGLLVGHLTAAGQPRGSVVVTYGHPAWAMLTVEDLTSATTVECRLTMADGHRINMGRFMLSGGYGEWTGPVPATPKDLRSAEILGPDGVILASAQLSS